MQIVNQRFNSQGFEVIAISLDTKESALRRLIREMQLPRPQHFDGQGWENEFAIRYGIFGIPTMWLVDKRGILRTTEVQVHYGLEEQVVDLLAEK